MATKPKPVSHKIATYSCDKSIMSAVKVLDYVHQMIGGATGHRALMAVDELLTTALKLQQEGCIFIWHDGKLHFTQKMLDAWCQTDKSTFNTTQEKILMALVAMFEPENYEDYQKYRGIDRAAYSREQEPNAPWKHVEHSVHIGSLGNVWWDEVVFDGGREEEALFRLWFQRSRC